MAFQIVMHAFNTIFGNIVDALRVSIGPSLIFCLIAVAAFAMFGPSFEELMWIMQGQVQDPLNPTTTGGASAEAAVSFSLIVFVLMLVLMIFFAWIAVAWHRFVLLEEYPQNLPQFRDRPILGYLGKSFVIAFVAILPALAVWPIGGIVALAVGDIIAPAAGEFVGWIVVFCAFVLLSYFWLRLAICLPGVAVGYPMTLREAWSASKPVDTQIIGIALILMAISFVSGQILSPIYGVLPIIAIALDLVVNWVVMMLGISILTTLYGHLVEGRDLT